QVLLDPQVVLEYGPDLEFQRIVTPVAGQRGERIEAAALVEVDQREGLPAGPEGDQRAEELRAEAGVPQGGVDRVQIADQGGQIVRGAAGEQPRVTVGVAAELHGSVTAFRVGPQQGAYLLLDAREGAALDRGETDRAGTGRGEAEGGVQGDRRRGQGEELVQIGPGRGTAAQQGVP